MTGVFSESRTQLRRDLGLLDAVGIGFGAVIGAGIFVVTGIAAGIAGPAILLALIVAAIAATANGLSSAQLAAAYPYAGGTYEYGYEVLNPWAGFVAGWMFLASKIAAAGTVALGLGGYVQILLPELSPRIVAVAAVILFTAVNYFGIRKSSRANLVIVSISLSSLLVFVFAGISSFRTENLRPFAAAGVPATLEASALLFFAYTGYARVATLGEEVRDPARNIPRAILLTLIGSAVLYIAVAAVALGAVGARALSESMSPLARAASAFSLPGASVIVAAGGLAAMLGVMLSQLLALSRMTFAMARRGDLPRFLASVHPTFGVPGRAVVVIGSIAAVVADTGTLGQVAAAASFTILLYYAITNVAALRMRSEAKRYPNVVPVVGLIACLVMVFSLSRNIVLTGCAVLAVGIVLRLLLILTRRRGDAAAKPS